MIGNTMSMAQCQFDILGPDLHMACLKLRKRTFIDASAFLLAALLFMALGERAFAAEQPIAMVTEISGEGEFVREGKASVLHVLAELHSNATIKLKKGARAVVLYLKSGDQYALSGPGSFTLGGDQPQSDKKTTGVVKLGPVTGKDGRPMKIGNASLSQAGIVMRTAGRRPIPAKTPLAAVVLATPSLFEWEAVAGNPDYEFVLKDEKGNTLFFRLGSENRLALPADIVLDSGGTYRWSVSARGSDGARYLSVYIFRLAEPDLKAEFENFYPPATATIAECVTFAAWLAGNNLTDEAARYWGTLSKRYGFAESRF